MLITKVAQNKQIDNLLHWHVVLKPHKLEDNCNNDYRISCNAGKAARTIGH